jgi:hypothetical protein
MSERLRDPLGMLARQWQTGAFAAGDGGSPVSVEVACATAAVALDEMQLRLPLESLVEPEPAPTVDTVDNGTAVRLAMELGRRLADEGAPEALSTLAAAYPFAPSAPGPRVRPFVGRVPDVRGLVEALLSVIGPAGVLGTFPALPGVEPATAARVERACRGWMGWLGGQLDLGGTGASTPPAWVAPRLEYRFKLTAATPAGRVDLVSDGYDGTTIDWYSVDRSAVAEDAPAAPVAPGAPVRMRPARVTYPGMPRPRVWEMEDGDVNLDTPNGNPAHAALVAFARRYASDWFVVPLEVASGVTVITTCRVTDTFGTVTDVPAAVDEDRGPWRMWELTGPSDGAVGLRLLLPTSPRPLEGPVLEDVLVVRDELANLAWVVEHTTLDGDGEPVDRYQRHLRLRPASDPAFAPATRGAADVYRLGTALPDYWYPLVAHPDRPTLVLAGASGNGDDGVRGTLVSHGPDSEIADAEVRQEGLRLVRRDRLSISGGRRAVWRARSRTPGLGEAAPSPRFDTLT